MKILSINNYHYLRGGAENVFLSEIDLIRKHGNVAHIFSRKHPQNIPSIYEKYFPREMTTDSITLTAKTLRSFLEIFYSLGAKKNLRKMMENFSFDVAHAHNISGRMTTSVLDCIYASNIPILMTLHDYKIICPNYKLMHHGRICEDCKKHNYYKAILNKCHKNSFLASSIYALETYFNFIFKKYKKNVRYFISPSLFLREKLIDFGWPEERIKYIPNFLSTNDFVPNFRPGSYFLYLGRLSSEKGIATLIKSFLKIKNPEIFLKIVGEGPIEDDLTKIAKSDDRISFSGYLCCSDLAEVTKNALAVVVPSEWYENAPLSILEAMAYGKPVIGARIGGIPEMIEDGNNGFLFESGNTDALTHVMSKLTQMTEAEIVNMGRLARRKVENEYNADLHYERLMGIYRKAINHSIYTGSCSQDDFMHCNKVP